MTELGIPGAVQAGLWGLLSGSALVLGALIGWFIPLSRRAIAIVMAFGAGVLISALSFELVDEAWAEGGIVPVLVGFMAGALIFTGLNALLAKLGARHRKSSSMADRLEEKREDVTHGDNSLGLALGALIDGIPEALVIGISLLRGGAVALVAVAAVFLSNIPEGLGSAAGMRKEGRGPAYVFGLWSGIALASGVSAYLGFALFAGASPAVVAGVQALAAGAILAMVVDTMVPEAFEGTQNWAGLVAVAGFLAAFSLSKAM